MASPRSFSNRALRRGALASLGALALAAGALAYWAPWQTRSSAPAAHRHLSHPGPRRLPPAAASSTTSAVPRPAPPYAVGITVSTYVDTSRLVYPPHTYGSQPAPRSLTTYIRYPAQGSPSGGEVDGAPPEKQAAPFPLVVFAPGYDETPQPYAPLLDAWVQAGYVVAAPDFPLTNPSAPGGPYEPDIVNQPADLSFLVDQLVAASDSSSSPLHGLVDPRRIAVAGQSDGAEAALAAAYDTCCRDTRVDAAIVLAGQELDVPNGEYYPPGSPPLLAAQGTDDDINPPSYTYQLFDAAPQPKYLLTLIGAHHLGPFTDDPTYEPIVASVTTAFLDLYLEHDPGALERMAAAAGPPSLATLQS